jgi:hypothetical protein
VTVPLLGWSSAAEHASALTLPREKREADRERVLHVRRGPARLSFPSLFFASFPLWRSANSPTTTVPLGSFGTCIQKTWDARPMTVALLRCRRTAPREPTEHRDGASGPFTRSCRRVGCVFRRERKSVDSHRFRRTGPSCPTGRCE